MVKKKRPQLAPDGVVVLARNRRATHDYQLHDRVEAGIVLMGSEVKSLRASKVSLGEGYAMIRSGEAWLEGVQIEEYVFAAQFGHEPLRSRKLLLHRDQINKLGIKTQQRGFTLIPLSIYVKSGKIKTELALVTGKRLYEKRESAKEAADRREMRQMSHRR